MINSSDAGTMLFTPITSETHHQNQPVRDLDTLNCAEGHRAIEIFLCIALVFDERHRSRNLGPQRCSRISSGQRGDDER